MGQKVNPIGMRLGIIRTWDSKWFAEKTAVPALVKEDNQIRTYLNEFYKKVSRGGIIVLDEYGKRGWGETDAVDEFLDDHKELEIKIKVWEKEIGVYPHEPSFAEMIEKWILIIINYFGSLYLLAMIVNYNTHLME